eukprot:m.755937 g.755937  ORF g.755937 m.755937 type:complete len:134 (+) comp59016_c0_seq16:4183-4584(+)
MSMFSFLRLALPVFCARMNSALLKAAQEGDLHQCVALIHDGADVNCVHEERSPLHHAAAGGHLLVVKLLVGRGADVNSIGNFGWTALMWATKNSHTDVVRFLLLSGADLSLQHSVWLISLLAHPEEFSNPFRC